MTTTTAFVGLEQPEIPDLPIPLTPLRTRADRTFFLVLVLGSSIVLVAIALILAFLVSSSLPAVRHAGINVITSDHWAPTGLHPLFGLQGVLVGTVVIAALALVVGVPVSIAAALTINEYAPIWLRRPLTAIIDLLAVLPSLLYGLWGLLVLSPEAYGVTVWLSHYAAFIPLFRPPENDTYGASIFLCGLVVGIMIIPIVTSVSREVMAQAPRCV